jgi:hypothetical protein
MASTDPKIQEALDHVRGKIGAPPRSPPCLPARLPPGPPLTPPLLPPDPPPPPLADEFVLTMRNFAKGARPKPLEKGEWLK